MLGKPKQKLSRNSKGKKWVKENAEYYGSVARPIIDKRRAIKLYNMAYGFLDNARYDYVTNPLATSRPELKGYPAKIRNIPIIPQNIAVLMGEKTKRFVDSQVVSLNTDLESQAKHEEREAVIDVIREDFVKRVQMKYGKEGPKDESQIAKDFPVLSEVVSKARGSVQDDLAIEGQQAIEYVRFAQELDRKIIAQAYDVFCINAMASYRDVVNDDVTFRDIRPDEISIVGDINMDFIEEAECVKREWKMSRGDILDFFQDDKDYSKLETYFEGDMSRAQVTGDTSIKYNSSTAADSGKSARALLWRNTYGNRDRFEDGDREVIEHIVWKSYAKLLTVFGYNDIVGEYEFEVTEDYVSEEKEEVVISWKEQYWEVYRIRGEFIIGASPLEFTSRTDGNPFASTNPYNGKVFPGLSIVELGESYQEKHNIISYNIEKLVNRNRGKIIVLPTGIIPDDEDMDEEQMFYYADATGYLEVDDSDKNKALSLQYIKVLDASLFESIAQLIDLGNSNKLEWDDLIGVNRQRKGQVNSSDGKAVNQQAEYRGSLMSEFLFTCIDDVNRRDFNAILNLSQHAWKKGKKAVYLNSEFRQAFLNINPETYSHASYLVGMNNNPRNTEKLELMRQYLQAFAQDPNFPKRLIPKMVGSDTMNQMVDIVEDIMTDLEDRQQRAAEAQQQAEKAEQELKSKELEATLSQKYYETDVKAKTDIDVALIRSDTSLLTFDTGDNVSDELNKSSSERLERTKDRIEKEKIAQKDRSDDKKLKAKEIDLKIAKQNKNKYDK